MSGIVESLSNLTAPPTLMTMAFDAIKNSIINGSLEAGNVYSEKTMADKLGISKTPVREALINLQLKGFVTILPKRGFQICLLTAKNISDIYEFRIALERAVVRKVATTITDEQERALEALSFVNQNYEEVLSFMEGDLNFHRYLARLTDNQKIIDSLEEIWDLCIWVGFNALTPGKDAKAVDAEHKILLSIVKRKDAQGAEIAVTQHLENCLKKILLATPS